MRYYAQYCNDPPVRNLMTVSLPPPLSKGKADRGRQFGTPHYGIAALIPCPTPPTLSCLLAARAARSGIYSTWAQTHLVQAAYFRDPARLEEFFQANTFLRDLNGENPIGEGITGGVEKGARGGGRGLEGLENLVAIMFDMDRELFEVCQDRPSS